MYITSANQILQRIRGINQYNIYLLYLEKYVILNKFSLIIYFFHLIILIKGKNNRKILRIYMNSYNPILFLILRPSYLSTNR